MATIEGTPAETLADSTPGQWTETTRLLCAAAYTDGRFAQAVVEEVLEEEYRAVNIPPGVDSEPVIRHCLAALGQKTRRDRVLAAILVLVVLLTVYRPALLVGFVLLGFLAAWGVVAHDLWTGTRVVTRRLNARVFDPAQAPAAARPQLAQRTEEIAERQAGNLTVYSGFLPFAGSGIDLGGWSFVVDLRKGKEEGTGRRLAPEPVEPVDLYAGIDRALIALGIPNLTIEDRVFVNGTDVRHDPALLASPTDRPSAAVTDADLQRLIVTPTHRVRHYTCIRVTDWRGELVLSLYLRFAVANGRLFCELSKFLLTPLKPELHQSDGIPLEPEFEDVVKLARRSLSMTLKLWLVSPSVVLRPLRGRGRRSRLEKRVKRDVFYDYGAAESALDRVRSPNYSRYFQLLDKEMYVKVLERTILDTIVDVLDMHNVDTQELVERRTTIINNGIMVPGGTVKADSIAVGTGARIANRLTGARQPAGEASGTGGGRNA